MEEKFEYVDVPEANSRHDREHGDPFEFNQTRTRSGWNGPRMTLRGKLTDKKIQKYYEQGHYAQELKDARKTLRESKKRKRDGNFALENGRMIYAPL